MLRGNQPVHFAASLILIVALATAHVPDSGAQDQPSTGTVIVAHGGDSLWNAGVIQVARALNTGGPVEVSFLMGPAAASTRFQDAVAKLEHSGATQIVVVPLLVSSHSGHYEQIRYLVGQVDSLDETMQHHLHMSGITRPTTRVALRLSPALDSAEEVAVILAERALALVRAQDDAPGARALLIVGHGPNAASDYAAWMANLRPVAARVQAMTGFRDVRVELVRDDAPAPVRAEAVLRTRELIELQRAVTGRDVIVIPVLISKGAVSRDKLPADLRGTASIYGGEPLLPHPAIARWVESRVRAARRP
jgi:sirohydrochlorin ferrochelatase